MWNLKYKTNERVWCTRETDSEMWKQTTGYQGEREREAHDRGAGLRGAYCYTQNR